MKQKLTPQEKQLYRRVDEILHYLWDPIGVAGIPQVRDEYDAYLPWVFKLVLVDESVEEIVEYLTAVATERMGLSADDKKTRYVAEILLDAKSAIVADSVQ
jgi:hypothetical protein